MMAARAAMSDEDCRAVVARFNREHGPGGEDDVLFVRELRDGGLDDRAIALVLATMDDVCLRCFDSPEPCYCARGE